MNTIIIDTTSNQKIKVGLKKGTEEYLIDQPITPQRTQVVLPLIEQLLNDQHLTLSDITHIQVNPGPGSFTGIRVGLTIANTLGNLLKIPVNENPINKPVEATYSA